MYCTCNPLNSVSLGSCRPLTGEKRPQTQGKAVESAGSFCFTVALWLEHMLRFGQHRNSSHRAAAGAECDLRGHDETIKNSKVARYIHHPPLILDWNRVTPMTHTKNTILKRTNVHWGACSRCSPSAGLTAAVRVWFRQGGGEARHTGTR